MPEHCRAESYVWGIFAILNIYLTLSTAHSVELTSPPFTKATGCHDCDRAGVVLGASSCAGRKRQNRLDCSNLREAVKWHLCLGRYCSVGEIYRALLRT
jgi:hypothetical protein